MLALAFAPHPVLWQQLLSRPGDTATPPETITSCSWCWSRLRCCMGLPAADCCHLQALPGLWAGGSRGRQQVCGCELSSLPTIGGPLLSLSTASWMHPYGANMRTTCLPVSSILDGANMRTICLTCLWKLLYDTGPQLVPTRCQWQHQQSDVDVHVAPAGTTMTWSCYPRT